MELVVKQISKEQWHELSGPAHQAVFQEEWIADVERIDFALLTIDPGDVLVQYATIREIDAETAYIQYGGSFPSYRGTRHSFDSFTAILDWLFSRYNWVSFLTENNNFPMLKFAIKQRFKIVGMRNFRNHVMLEHLRHKEE